MIIDILIIIAKNVNEIWVNPESIKVTKIEKFFLSSIRNMMKGCEKPHW